MPEDGSHVDEWELYAVKALIKNYGPCELRDVEVRLMMEGDVMLAPDTVNPVVIPSVLPPDEDCNEDGCARLYEVVWMVQCIGHDDPAKFRLCVESTGGEDTRHMQFKSSNKVKVYQEKRDRAKVCVDIVSPDTGSIYATSQEFAISAIITNMEKDAPITIDDAWIWVDDLPSWHHHRGHMEEGGNIMTLDPIPDLPWVIGPEDSMTVTWTAQCTGSGLSEIKVGINTGMMYFGPIGTQEHREISAYGEDINLAKRLQEEAQPGQIIVGERTHRFTRKAFEFETLQPLTLKGIEKPIQAYSAIKQLPRPEKIRGIEGLRARMIGRDDELAKLKDALDEVLNGRGQMVSIVGEAGVGKSRLVRELTAMADGGWRAALPGGENAKGMANPSGRAR